MAFSAASAVGAADALRAAELSVTPIEPLSERYPGLTLEDAYGIQQAGSAARRAAGGELVGRKAGLTSQAMQTLLGVDEPDFGDLFADMAVEDGDAIRLSELVSPKVEAEIAFVLGHDLAGPGVTTAAALRAIEAAVPAIEVVDSRIADWRIKLVDTVADNASSARYVLGSRLTPLAGLDLRTLGLVFERNGRVAEMGVGAAVLGHPVRCVAWLANTLARFGGRLAAGDVVLSGALHRAFDVAAGDVLHAEFATLGSVRLRVEA
jgi:2-oxopent-4-enoate hydratase